MLKKSNVYLLFFLGIVGSMTAGRDEVANSPKLSYTPAQKARHEEAKRDRAFVRTLFDELNTIESYRPSTDHGANIAALVRAREFVKRCQRIASVYSAQLDVNGDLKTDVAHRIGTLGEGLYFWYNQIIRAERRLQGDLGTPLGQ